MKDIKPVAWQWFYINQHCTVNEELANELMADGVDVTPLYAIPEWCVVVPVEPTDEMRSAYLDASIAPISTLSIAGYKAMIKTARDRIA